MPDLVVICYSPNEPWPPGWGPPEPDPTAPVLIAVSPPVCPPSHAAKTPPKRRARRLHGLPPLDPWPSDDSPGRMTEPKAVWALARIADGYPKAEIGRSLGLSRSSVWAVSAGHTFRHLPRPAALAA